MKVPVRIPSPLEAVGNVGCLAMFIHGKDDWITDSRQSRILYENAKEPKNLVILGSGEHAESLYWNREKEFYCAVREWFGEYL